MIKVIPRASGAHQSVQLIQLHPNEIVRHHAHPSSRPPLLQNLPRQRRFPLRRPQEHVTRARSIQHRWNLQIFNLAVSQRRKRQRHGNRPRRIDQYRAKFASSSSSSLVVVTAAATAHFLQRESPQVRLYRRYREQRSSRRQHSSHLVRVQFWHDVESVPSKAQSALLVRSRVVEHVVHVRTLRVRASIQEITRSCVV